MSWFHVQRLRCGGLFYVFCLIIYLAMFDFILYAIVLPSILSLLLKKTTSIIQKEVIQHRSRRKHLLILNMIFSFFYDPVIHLRICVASSL